MVEFSKHCPDFKGHLRSAQQISRSLSFLRVRLTNRSRKAAPWQNLPSNSCLSGRHAPQGAASSSILNPFNSQNTHVL